MQTQPAEENKILRTPVMLRSRVVLILGWTLLIVSLTLLWLHVLLLWKRMGAGAPLVGIGLLIDALVGTGLILAGSRMRRKQ